MAEQDAGNSFEPIGTINTGTPAVRFNREQNRYPEFFLDHCFVVTTGYIAGKPKTPYAGASLHLVVKLLGASPVFLLSAGQKSLAQKLTVLLRTIRNSILVPYHHVCTVLSHDGATAVSNLLCMLSAEHPSLSYGNVAVFFHFTVQQSGTEFSSNHFNRFGISPRV